LKGANKLAGKYLSKMAAGLMITLTVGFIVSCNSNPAPSVTKSPSGSAVTSPSPANKTMPGQNKTYSAYPPMVIDQGKQYTAIIDTNKGKLTLELFAKDVPKTVNNFVFLARDGFYNGVTFHRVIKTPAPFMAQGGDPTGTGRGGPGYQFADEFSSHKHITGALSMANSGPNTNGSQFFICYAPQSHLDNLHSVFGQLTGGMDVLLKLENGDVMREVTIVEK
jgi:peptidyl-prolyl cis-trans isomerase B (cyclophilin B)